MINIVLFGPPGAGKGTQSEKLIAKYGFVHLSTGDIFRKNIREASELGQLAKSYMDQGQLVPDSVTISMLEAEIVKNKNARGFIFDGFPRNVNQASALNAFLEGNNSSVSKMIALEVPEEELRKRLLERGKTSGRPDDIDPLVIQKRIDVYNSETSPVKEFYLSQGKYEGINGVGSIDSIFNLICNAIDKLLPADKPAVVVTEKKTEEIKPAEVKPAKPKNIKKPAKVTAPVKTKKKVIKKKTEKKSKKKTKTSLPVKKKSPSAKKKKNIKSKKRGRPASPKRRGRPQIKKRGRPTLPKRRGRPQIKKRGRPTLPKRRGRPQIKKRGRPTSPKKRGRPQIKKRGRPTLPKRRGRPQIKKRGRPVAKKIRKVKLVAKKKVVKISKKKVVRKKIASAKKKKTTPRKANKKSKTNKQKNTRKNKRVTRGKK